MGCCYPRDSNPISPYSDETTKSQRDLYDLLAKMIADREAKQRQEQEQYARQEQSRKEYQQYLKQQQRLAQYSEPRKENISEILAPSPFKDQPQPKSQILNSSQPMPPNVLNSHKYNYLIEQSQLHQNQNPEKEFAEEQEVKNQPLSQTSSLSELEQHTTSSELVEIHLDCFYCNCQIIENILALPCQHYFHEQCFTQIVSKQIDENVLSPTCQCGTRLQQINIQQSVSSDILDKYLQKQSEYQQQITNI